MQASKSTSSLLANKTPLSKRFAAVASSAMEESTPKTPAELRVDAYSELALGVLATRLVAAEDELAARKLQTAKRLALFLNLRLEGFIKEWKAAKEAQSEEDVRRLALAISEGRKAVEGALQMMITQQPPGITSSPPPSMRFAVKARFQGTPVSTLKPARVSASWVGRLVHDKSDDGGSPLFSLGA